MVTGLVLKAAASGLLLAQYDGGQDYGGGGGGGIVGLLFGGVFFLIWLVVILAIVASMWKIFDKAGKPGWAALVPIYNIVVLLEIVGKPIWWIVLFFIPCANFIAAVLVTLELAKAFGKETGFAIGMILLPIVFYPLLAFSDARYTPPPVQA
jgi:hypothetical protein